MYIKKVNLFYSGGVFRHLTGFLGVLLSIINKENKQKMKADYSKQGLLKNYVFIQNPNKIKYIFIFKHILLTRLRTGPFLGYFACFSVVKVVQVFEMVLEVYETLYAIFKHPKCFLQMTFWSFFQKNTQNMLFFRFFDKKSDFLEN